MKNDGLTLTHSFTFFLACFLGLLFSIASNISYADESKIKEAAVDIITIEKASQRYFLEVGQWPNNLKQLHNTGFLDRNVTQTPWESPYKLKLEEGIFTIKTLASAVFGKALNRYLVRSQFDPENETLFVQVPQPEPTLPKAPANPTNVSPGVISNLQRFTSIAPMQVRR